ncbi:MAG: 2TM domain-containing protein [Solirubrobacterales bacterium]
MNDEIMAPSSEEGLRKEALASIRRKRAFRQTAICYVLVNAFLVLIWALGDAGYFWPGWVIGGWGIGLGFQGWDAYHRRRHVSEDEVSREMDRLRGG